MHFLVLINTCSHTYTCLPVSSHADAHPGEEQIQGECLPFLQMHPAIQNLSHLEERCGV